MTNNQDNGDGPMRLIDRYLAAVAAQLGIDINGLATTMQAMIDGSNVGTVFINDASYSVKSCPCQRFPHGGVASAAPCWTPYPDCVNVQSSQLTPGQAAMPASTPC